MAKIIVDRRLSHSTMDRILWSYLFVALTLLCTVSCATVGQSNLHTQLRRALQSSASTLCVDKSQCVSQPGVCDSDPDLALVLCPSMCGSCVCEDNPATEGSCPQLVPDVCEGELAESLCPKTCGLCDQFTPVCFDHVIGLTCSELPDPCNDPLGMVACPKFCGLCKNEATTATTPTTTSTTTTPTTTSSTTPTTTSTTTPTTTSTTTPTTMSTTTTTTTPSMPPTSSTMSPPSPDICNNNPCLNTGVCQLDSSTNVGYTCTCPDGFSGWICQIKIPPTPKPVPGCSLTSNKNNISCVPSEVVFIVEYAYSDAYYNGVDHETDFITEIADIWYRLKKDVRIGVVVYHDTVTEEIHISDYEKDFQGLKKKLAELGRQLKPSGSADLAKALDYVRDTSFVGARPDAEKIVIPIVHNMNSRTKDNIPDAAQRLKDTCVIISAIEIYSQTIDRDIITELVNEPYSDYLSSFSSHYSLEETGKYLNQQNTIACNP